MRSESRGRRCCLPLVAAGGARVDEDLGSLHLTSHQVIENARTLEDSDVAIATDWSMVDEDVGHRLASREVR
jgi:hypothetical protein